MKCKYNGKCKYYDKDSFTCNTYRNENYCGSYRRVIFENTKEELK
jgi:hypothetical protein